MTWLFWLLLGLIVGALAGVMIVAGYFISICVGDLRVDRSDPDDQPYLFLELMKDGYERLQTKNYVVFRVRRENYLPRE